MMDKPNNKSIQEEIVQRKTDRKSLFIGGLVVLFISISPFVFYSYRSFPDDSKVRSFAMFSIETSYYTVYDYAWYFFGTLVPLYLFLLWFFTCKHWWHWIILIPIAMYSFQLWGVINESNNLDELEIYYLIPLMMFLIPFVYLIRAKLFAKARGVDLKKFEEELGETKTIWQQIKELFQ